MTECALILSLLQYKAIVLSEVGCNPKHYVLFYDSSHKFHSYQFKLTDYLDCTWLLKVMIINKEDIKHPK